MSDSPTPAQSEPFIPVTAGQEPPLLSGNQITYNSGTNPLYATAQRPAAAHTNTMAILALVFTFLCWPLAIVFGHIARSQIKKTGEDGKGMALAALTISYVAVGIITLLIVVAAASVGTPASGSTLQAPSIPLAGEASSDVVITQCTPSSQVSSTGTLRVTNSTSQTQSYMITVSLNDPSGTRVAEANAITNSLAAGQSANVDILGPSTATATSCTVAQVLRLPV